MNAKKAKQLRKFWDGENRPSWRDIRYTDSNHPREKPHQKIFMKPVKQYTKAGAKTINHQIPMKVGTVLLVPSCGRSLYRISKKMA